MISMSNSVGETKKIVINESIRELNFSSLLLCFS